MKIDINDMGAGIEALKNQSHGMDLIINPIINKYNPPWLRSSCAAAKC